MSIRVHLWFINSAHNLKATEYRWKCQGLGIPLGKRIEVRGFFAPNIIPPHPNLLPREKEFLSVFICVHLWLSVFLGITFVIMNTYT